MVSGKEEVDMMNKCKYCSELPEDCTCKKLRILLRLTLVDYNGVAAECLYKTAVVFVPDKDNELFGKEGARNYEVIGGEWMAKE